MGQQFPPVTDYDIQALIDNELDHESEKRVRLYLEQNETAKRYYEDLVRQKKLLQMWGEHKKSLTEYK
jgi:anti-sigma factor RsiW